jgi:RimJ/RimL family protein N-acetyltransferase
MLKKGFKWLSDMKYIEIGVLEYNEIAIEWYKRLGFEFTGEKEDFTVGDFVGKDWVLKMKKELSKY